MYPGYRDRACKGENKVKSDSIIQVYICNTILSILGFQGASRHSCNNFNFEICFEEKTDKLVSSAERVVRKTL